MEVLLPHSSTSHSSRRRNPQQLKTPSVYFLYAHP